jgi:xylulokinase
MPDRAPLLGGVDVGTTHSKIALYASRGRAVAARRIATPGDGPALVGAVFAALAECVEQVGRPPVAVGVASMAETGVALDAALAPLHPLIRWDDPRGGDELAVLSSRRGEVAAVSGANLSVKTPLVRWAWLGRHHPELLAATRAWVSAADLVATELTGEPVTDATLAGRTGAYDHHAGRWHADLCAAAGLHPDRLPRVAPAGRPAGTVRPGAAARTGLPAGTPVAVAGHDHLVAAYAAGVRDTGQLADSMGTAEAVVLLTDTPPTAPGSHGLPVGGDGSSWNVSADGRHHCLIAGFPGSGRLVDWFCRAWLGRVDGARYDAFAELAGQVTGRPTGILVEPYLEGRAAPRPDPGARLRIHGLTGSAAGGHGRAELAVALLEGASLHVRWMIAELAARAGPTGPAVAAGGSGPGGGLPVSVTVLGGPSRSGPWLRVKATAGGAPLSVVGEPEAACAGAAMLAGAAVGVELPALPSRRVAAPAGEVTAYDAFYAEHFLPHVTGHASPDRTMPEPHSWNPLATTRTPEPHAWNSHGIEGEPSHEKPA